jgi:hypothetical protein
MSSTWVFPSAICLEKLKQALSKTLHDYPHAAGRFSYDSQGRKWQIKLTNDGVPVVLGRTNLFLNDDLMRQQPHPDVIDASVFPPITPVDLFDQPLLKLKLVSWDQTGEASLSLAWNHGLGTTIRRRIIFVTDVQPHAFLVRRRNRATPFLGYSI